MLRSLPYFLPDNERHLYHLWLDSRIMYALVGQGDHNIFHCPIYRQLEDDRQESIFMPFNSETKEAGILYLENESLHLELPQGNGKACKIFE